MQIEFSQLAHVPLLEGLQPDDFNELLTMLEVRAYGAGETLFIKGDPGGALMIVLSGEVDLFIYDEHNTKIVLSQITAGGFFGEVTVFDNSPRSTNALATQATQIVILRQEAMTNFLHKHPDTAIHMIMVLSRRLRDTTQLISAKNINAFQMLQQSSHAWERIADRLSGLVGSWGYLLGLFVMIGLWLTLSALSGSHDFPTPYDALGILITTLGALQLPLIMMSQKRQDHFEQIQAELDHQVNVRAQLSILEVTRKLDWLQEAMLSQTIRLEKIEVDHESLHSDSPINPNEHPELVNTKGPA